ncbi:uncharacterized protein LOC141529565 [Cotesia typhae]|uniref:uncharacterized protein LOC141529565 n=1 Tax=Cotesia typhae TaxID=2053667 RepID=UPI003D69CBBC
MTNATENCLLNTGLLVLYIIYLQSVIAESKIESASDLEREFADKPTRSFRCCARHEKKIGVGYGVSGEIISIDSGHCRRVCPRHASDDPGDVSKPAVQRCPPRSQCHPRSSRMERISTLQGVKIVEVIDSCDCWHESPCSRTSFEQLVHAGTPYQVAVDVGLCLGTCSKALGCRPFKNGTVSIKGPNGDEIYQVIQECGCADSCHRMERIESILDYSQLEIKRGSNTSDVKPLIRHINVGHCDGSCPGNHTEKTCLLRDKKNPARCLAGLYSKQYKCTPVRFKVHEYRTRRGSKREIIEITSCACV